MFAAFRSPAEIRFGEGMRRALPDVVRRHGRRAFVCADPHIATSDQFLRLLDDLRDAGVEAAVFSDVVSDLPIEIVTDSVAAARRARPDVVVGIGGGSSIDLAKVTTTLLVHGGQVSDYYGEFRVPGPILPLVAMPTTAGTGSEVTPVAVLTDPEIVNKVGISSPYLIPTVALCDPEFTYTCPATVTAHSGADALAHCIEALTAVQRPADPGLLDRRVFVGDGEITSELATLGIRHLARGLQTAYREPGNVEARADTMLGSLLAGFSFATAGTAAAHALQYPIGAVTHTPHGLGVGTLLPYVMEFNRPVRVRQMASIARIFGVANPDDESAASEAPHAVARYLSAIGIPASLADLGFDDDKIDWAAERAVEATRLAENNPVPLGEDQARTILHAAHRGELSLLAEELTTTGEGS